MDIPSISAEEAAKFSLGFAEEQFITPDKIYLDAGLLRDFRLGAAISTFLNDPPNQAQEKFAHILERLPIYKNRAFYDVPYYFPKLSVTNEQIDTLLTTSDDQTQNMIYRLAPATPFSEVLHSHTSINTNHSSAKGHDAHIVYTINTYPLRLNNLNKRATAEFFALHLGVSTRFICTPTIELPKQEFADIDEFYLTDVQEFLKNPEIFDAVDTLTFSEKRIFAAKNFGTTTAFAMNVRRAEALIQLSLTSGSKDFKFIPGEWITPKPPEPEQQPAKQPTLS